MCKVSPNICEHITNHIPDIIDKLTPLHIACFGGHKEVAQYLVERLKFNTGKFNDQISVTLQEIFEV